MVRAYSKKELAGLYGVSWKVLKKWLTDEGIILKQEDRIIKPSIICIIFEKIGKPK